MQLAGRLTLGVLAVAAGSVAALAQSAVISARSGLIHYVEGQVYLGDQLVETKFGSFPEVKENQQLKTEEGRAEVLLTPGVFLRLGENSSFRMITNRLIDTRLEFLSGAAVVEADDIGKDNSVTVVYRDATIHPVKKGVYRFDADGGELRVFDGVAEVTSGDQTVEVKEGHLIALDTLAVRKFDKTVTDALNRWSERRDSYVSMANVGAATSLRTSLYGGGSPFLTGWYFNPVFGMYSFVPGMGGMFYSPYGNPFFSPFDVYMAYMPGFYGGYGYGGYGYGYPGSYSSGYSAYNSVGYKTVPAPSHSGASKGASGSSGSVAPVASGHGPSVGSLPSAPISHGGGATAGGHH
jgi:hypothetical protein